MNELASTLTGPSSLPVLDLRSAFIVFATAALTFGAQWLAAKNNDRKAKNGGRRADDPPTPPDPPTA